MGQRNQSSTKTEAVLNLSGDQKFQVLLEQLKERYQAWHHMRSRSMQFAIWIMGLAIVASWKLIQEPCTHVFQRVAATLFVILLGFAARYFLRSLDCGIKKNREALVNVEIALGNHDQDVFLQGKNLLPEDYIDLKPRTSSHMKTLYLLLAVTGLYLLGLIWLPSNPSPRKESTAKQPIDCTISTQSTEQPGLFKHKQKEVKND